MHKKILFILIGFLLFSRANLVFASPVINEIMYDLDGADIDWVEIYNPDNEDIDLTNFKLLISNSSSNHSIEKYSGSEILHTGEYGVIVPTSDISDFTNKWGSNGNIFTASFSLPNETEKVEINEGDKNTHLSSVTYSSSQGASGDGNSLQFVNGSWLAIVPTPGSTNKSAVSSSFVSSSGGGENSIVTTDTSFMPSVEVNKKEKTSEVPVIKTKIIANRLVFAGVPIELKPSSTGLSGEILSSGKYFWNFGDGDSKEINGTEKFTHTYSYSGEYTVSLEYYANIYNPNPDAIDRIMIKVVPVQIVISKVGDEKDFFVELTNNSEYEIDISKWILSGSNKNFIFPKNSIVMPKKSMIVSNKVTQFIYNEVNNLKLFTSTGDIAFDYNTLVLPVQALEKTILNTNTTASVHSVSEPKINIPIKNLSASVVDSDIIPNNSKNSLLSTIGLIIFLGISASGVYFIRRSRVASGNEDDFEILDE